MECAFRTADSSQVATTPLSMLPAQYQSGDAMFPFAGSYGLCSTQGLARPAAGQQLLATVIASTQAAPPPPPDSPAWVPVEVLPQLSAAQLQEHADGRGRVAICTPPLHTDAYAPFMVEWAEFQALVGVDKVFVYDFNSGPLLRPLVDHYASTGLFEVFEWLIPRAILANPDQECLLPFFHASPYRERFRAAACTMHQDNYNIAWQVLTCDGE